MKKKINKKTYKKRSEKNDVRKLLFKITKVKKINKNAVRAGYGLRINLKS